MNKKQAVDHLIDMALADMTANDISFDEAALHLIASFEDCKNNLSSDEREFMRQAVLEAVQTLTEQDVHT